MAKRHKRRNAYSGLSKYHPPSATDISDDVETDSTLVPAERDQTTTINNYWMANSTSAPDIDDEEENESAFAETWSSLADKGLQGKIQLTTRSVFLLTVIAWVVSCSWLFLTDNQMGRLDTFVGLQWFLNKVLLLTAFYFVVFLILILYSVVARRAANPKKKNRPHPYA